MKDYNLLLYLAKLTGAKPKKSKTSLYCFFPYSDEVAITTFFTFKNKKSTGVYFDLEDIHSAYATNYGSYRDFVEAICNQYTFFEPAEVSGDLYVYSDLSVNKIENTASAALTNITVMVNCLNEMLGRNEDGFSEEEWRNLHRDLLAKQKRNSLFATIGSVAGFILGILSISYANGRAGFFAAMAFLLGVPLLLGGIGASVFFGFRYKYYSSQLKKSLNAK